MRLIDLDATESYLLDGRYHVDLMKQGHWIAVTYGDMRCSCCGDVYGVCGGLMGEYNYCPTCGAYMKGEQDDETD